MNFIDDLAVAANEAETEADAETLALAVVEAKFQASTTSDRPWGLDEYEQQVADVHAVYHPRAVA